MKVCVLVVASDLRLAAVMANQILGRIRGKVLPRDRQISVIAVSTEEMDRVLLRGKDLPAAYMEAQRRLILAADNTASLYLDKIDKALGDFLTSDAHSGPIPEDTPEGLLMSEAVMKACAKLQITRVWIHDISPDTATEALMAQRLEKVGLPDHGKFTVLKKRDHESETELLRAISELNEATDLSKRARLVNQCREILSRLAEITGAEAIILDRLAQPFLDARTLTVEWGPTIIPAYDIYLNEAAEWVERQLTGQGLHDKWFTNGSSSDLP